MGEKMKVGKILSNLSQMVTFKKNEKKNDTTSFGANNTSNDANSKKASKALQTQFITDVNFAGHGGTVIVNQMRKKITEKVRNPEYMPGSTKSEYIEKTVGAISYYQARAQVSGGGSGYTVEDSDKETAIKKTIKSSKYYNGGYIEKNDGVLEPSKDSPGVSYLSPFETVKKHVREGYDYIVHRD